MAVNPIQHLNEIATMALSCLATAATGNPDPPQNSCLRIGDEIIHDLDLYQDLCCQGLAYVAIGDIYPSADGFPEPDVFRQANTHCGFPAWGINLRMGLVRCVPAGGETMLSCEEWTGIVHQSLADAQTLAEAACCFRTQWWNEELGLSVVLGSISTTPPMGGCIERFTNLQIQTRNCPTCP